MSNKRHMNIIAAGFLLTSLTIAGVVSAAWNSGNTKVNKVWIDRESKSVHDPSSTGRIYIEFAGKVCGGSGDDNKIGGLDINDDTRDFVDLLAKLAVSAQLSGKPVWIRTSDSNVDTTTGGCDILRFRLLD